MKKLVLTTLSGLLLCVYNNSFCQFLTDDINLGSTAGDLNTLAFTGNWGTTHGTPTYAPTFLVMWSNNNGSVPEGEGVSASYNFEPNTGYIINLGIHGFTSSNIDENDFVILLTNNPPNLNGVGSPSFTIPHFASERVLYQYHGESFLDNILTLKFSTGSLEQWNSIVIYPLNTGGSDSQSELYLGCINIKSGCVLTDSKVYSTSTIRSSENLYEKIYIGSSYGGTTSMVNSVSTTSSSFVANHSINIRHNTTLSVSGNNFITLEIADCNSPLSVPLPVPTNRVVDASLESVVNPCPCYNCKPGDSSTTHDTHPVNNSDRKRTISDNDSDFKTNIYPNPSKENIQVSIGKFAEKFTVIIASLDGKLMHSQDYSGESATVDISHLKSGIYIISVSDGINKEIQKLVKQ